MKFIAMVLLSAAACAQDTRHVTEPKIPPACATLMAKLAAPAGVLGQADEGRQDTQRIQRALDGCTPGHSVALKANGSSNAFLTGPLQLRRGVTLVVERDTMLLASRDPRLYDTVPGGCGVVSKAAQHCKPIISGDGIPDAGVMGDGVIDGRGGATLLGQKLSWWDVAAKANTRPVIVGVSGRQQCPHMMTKPEWIARWNDNFRIRRDPSTM
jgi:polygalacturonase